MAERKPAAVKRAAQVKTARVEANGAKPKPVKRRKSKETS